MTRLNGRLNAAPTLTPKMTNPCRGSRPQKPRRAQVYLPEMRPGPGGWMVCSVRRVLAPPVRALPRHAAQPAPAAPPPGEPVAASPACAASRPPASSPAARTARLRRLPHPRRCWMPCATSSIKN